MLLKWEKQVCWVVPAMASLVLLGCGGGGGGGGGGSTGGGSSGGDTGGGDDMAASQTCPADPVQTATISGRYYAVSQNDPEETRLLQFEFDGDGSATRRQLMSSNDVANDGVITSLNYALSEDGRFALTDSGTEADPCEAGGVFTPDSSFGTSLSGSGGVGELFLFLEASSGLTNADLSGTFNCAANDGERVIFSADFGGDGSVQTTDILYLDGGVNSSASFTYSLAADGRLTISQGMATLYEGAYTPASDVIGLVSLGASPEAVSCLRQTPTTLADLKGDFYDINTRRFGDLGIADIGLQFYQPLISVVGDLPESQGSYIAVDADTGLVAAGQSQTDAQDNEAAGLYEAINNGDVGFYLNRNSANGYLGAVIRQR